MAIVSGKSAVINGKKEILDWSISFSQTSAVSHSSSTDGSAIRLGGIEDWSGNYKQHGLPTSYPGDSLTFAGKTATGVGNVYGGTALVRQCVIEADIEGGGLLTTTVEFEGNSDLTRTTGTATDAGSPAPMSCVGLKVNWNGSDRSDVTQWRLTLTSNNPSYASSGTSGGTRRVAGHKDASFEWTEKEGDPANFPAEATTAVLQLYVNDTAFFELTSGIIENVSQQVSVETGEVVGGTVSGSFTGWNGATKGSIAKPAGGGDWWP